MSRSNNIPENLRAGVRNALAGVKCKIAIKRLMRLEKDRQGRQENKILALSAYKLFLLSAKETSVKVESSIHYLEIQGLESKKQNQLVLRTMKGSQATVYNLRSIETTSSEVDDIIVYIVTALKSVFPTTPTEKLIPTLDVQPQSRTELLQTNLRMLEKKDPGPCGGYSQMYSCMCAYHDLPFRDEVSWDIDMIYLFHNSRELRLADFDHMFPKDLVPIISALEHNSWFTSLKVNAAKDKMTPETVARIMKVIQKNNNLERVDLSGLGLKVEQMKNLSTALTSNISTALTCIDLSNNPLEDRGVTYLSGPVSKFPQGLKQLGLASVGMTTKGFLKLIEALTNQKTTCDTLTYLNVSGNNLKDDIQPFLNYLAQPNSLVELNISGTDIALDAMSEPLLRGCAQKLEVLSMSRNPFSHRKSREVPMSWKKFLAAALKLRKLDLSGCKLPTEALKELLLGIGSNREISDLDLDLSHNDLKTDGSNVLSSCIANIPITRLDLTNNGFDSDLISLLSWIQHNQTIRHLAIGQNVSGILPRTGWLSASDKDTPLQTVLDKILDLIVDEKSNLESLSLADSKLKGETATILNGLGSNHKLVYLDISGNHMEDFGARMLAKALQLNTKLKTIHWDRNGTSATGFEDMAFALQRNYTLLDMPTPVHDAAAALRTNPQRTEQALQQVEAALQRNHRSRRYVVEQEYRIERHKLVQSVIQPLYKGIESVQRKVEALNMKQDSVDETLEESTLLVRDAENWMKILPEMKEIMKDSEADLEDRVKEMMAKLSEIFLDNVQETCQKLVGCAKARCPSTCEDKELSEKLDVCTTKQSRPEHVFEEVEVIEQIMKKFSKLNLALSLTLSRHVVDHILKLLSTHDGKLKDKINNQIQKDKPDTTDGKVIRISRDELAAKESSTESMYDSPSITRMKREKKTSIRPKSVNINHDLEPVTISLEGDVTESDKIDAAAGNNLSVDVLDVPSLDVLTNSALLTPSQSALSSNTSNTESVSLRGTRRPPVDKPKPAVRPRSRGSVDTELSEAKSSDQHRKITGTPGSRPESVGEGRGQRSVFEGRRLFTNPGSLLVGKALAPPPAKPPLLELKDIVVVQSQEKLQHFTKDRPRRLKTHRPTKPAITGGHNPMDDVIPDDGKREAPQRPKTSPSPQVAILPPAKTGESTALSKDEENNSDKLDKKPSKGHGFKMADFKGGISNLFGHRKKSTPERGPLDKKESKPSDVNSVPSDPKKERSTSDLRKERSTSDPKNDSVKKVVSDQSTPPTSRMSPPVRPNDRPSPAGVAPGVDKTDGNVEEKPRLPVSARRPRKSMEPDRPETEPPVEAEPEDKPPQDAPKRPPGAPRMGLPGMTGGMGFSAGLMSEMKAKRESKIAPHASTKAEREKSAQTPVRPESGPNKPTPEGGTIANSKLAGEKTENPAQIQSDGPHEPAVELIKKTKDSAEKPVELEPKDAGVDKTEQESSTDSPVPVRASPSRPAPPGNRPKPAVKPRPAIRPRPPSRPLSVPVKPTTDLAETVKLEPTDTRHTESNDEPTENKSVAPSTEPMPVPAARRSRSLMTVLNEKADTVTSEKKLEPEVKTTEEGKDKVDDVRVDGSDEPKEEGEGHTADNKRKSDNHESTHQIERPVSDIPATEEVELRSQKPRQDEETEDNNAGTVSKTENRHASTVSKTEDKRTSTVSKTEDKRTSTVSKTEDKHASTASKTDTDGSRTPDSIADEFEFIEDEIDEVDI